MKKYFTTPIYYVNDVPHIGHAYCTLATDTLVRYWRKKIGEENVFFLTGTDENSQKTVDAAAASGKEIFVYLEEISSQWRETWERLGISFDDFIRTTEDRHLKVVLEIVGKMEKSGDIYKGKYSGKYCSGCEAFLKDADLDEDGFCPAHKRAPEVIEEENYFFRLSKYEKLLLELFEKNKEFLLPVSRRHEILNFIKSGLEDISISRESAEFGISLPFDDKHKIYVWIDALINYYSGNREKAFWPAIHIIGKDISRFHAVMWPAMLLSAGIEPPRQIFAHGFFTVDGVKMSKTLGNVVCPLDLSAKFGNDALRVGLLSSFEFGGDGDFSVAHFSDFYRTRLAGGVGNLFNRVIVLVHKFLDGKKPKPAGAKDFDGEKIWKTFCGQMEGYEIREAIDTFFGLVHSANQLLNETEVWRLAKTDLDAAEKVFAVLLVQLELLVRMSEVLLPETCPRMVEMLGDEKRVGEGGILFPIVE